MATYNIDGYRVEVKTANMRSRRRSRSTTYYEVAVYKGDHLVGRRIHILPAASAREAAEQVIARLKGRGLTGFLAGLFGLGATTTHSRRSHSREAHDERAARALRTIKGWSKNKREAGLTFMWTLYRGALPPSIFVKETGVVPLLLRMGLIEREGHDLNPQGFPFYRATALGMTTIRIMRGYPLHGLNDCVC